MIYCKLASVACDLSLFGIQHIISLAGVGARAHVMAGKRALLETGKIGNIHALDKRKHSGIIIKRFN